jgi:hypothetical protein
VEAEKPEHEHLRLIDNQQIDNDHKQKPGDICG